MDLSILVKILLGTVKN